TATEGEDYFAPGDNSITFGPGQRSARILIPLVQDSLVEGDEAFVLELDTSAQISVDDVYQRIVVLIRDDEPQTR
ncbi:MAG: Calx-beta domain-containing protein, partial [Woeseiaceae bacterium]